MTDIGQLESGCTFIFVLVDVSPPPARWKCGNPAFLFLAGFPSPVERVGNSLFEFSTLSTGRHFHGAWDLVVLGAQRRGACARGRLAALFLLRLFFRSRPKSDLSSPKFCARIAQDRRSHQKTICRYSHKPGIHFSLSFNFSKQFLKIR